MPTTFTSNVFSSTYKDDFLDSDNYHRVLFNSGRALQARELTQMQTIIQEEVGRFGRNIFKEGAAVNPGGPSITNSYEFVKLDTQVAANALPTDLTSVVGVELTGATSTVKARVLEAVNAIGNDPATIYVQYTNTSGGATGTTPVRFAPSENLSGGGFNFKVQDDNSTDNPAIGVGSKIHNDGGDFFVRGHFVFVKPQGLILSKYSPNPTAVVGFRITEDIVTVNDTTALYDNQGTVANTTSPGADRYRIQLVLTTQDAIVSGQNFVYYCDVAEGNIVDQVKGTDDYNKINDLLAERTKEESGNYIANRFNSNLSESGNNTILGVGSGIAYVNGYRAVNESPTSLTIAKPRAITTIENDVVGVSYGSYVICTALKGALNIDDYTVINLSESTTDASLSGIGTAKVRYVEKSGSNFKVYLFDIKMDSGESFRDTKIVGTDNGNFATLSLEGNPGKAVLKESINTGLIFPLQHSRPANISDVSFEVQRLLTGAPSGSTTLTISSLGTGETYVNTSQVIVTTDDGAVVTPTQITGGSSLVIEGLVDGTTYNIYAKVNKSQPTVRPKGLVETTKTAAIATDAVTGVKYVDLQKTDLFKVISIKQTDSDGIDLSSRFTIDDGQRPGHYANARIIIQDGATAPSGNVFCRFKHFTHGAGDYFSMKSYQGTFSLTDINENYKSIPNYKVNSRGSVSLRDVIDFRSSVDASGTFTGAGAASNEIITNGDVFQADIQYYLPRKDKVVITTQGEVKNILGENGFSSQIPPTPENTLALFELEHNAFGLHDSDTLVRPLEAKRFTMRDISKLEKRIDKLEEVTSLSLLEVDTSTLLVLDANGDVRTKSGFFVDNFMDRAFTDVQNPMHRSAIDPSLGILQPQQVDDNVTLRYDSDLSTNTILKGDTVYIKHNSVSAISQTKVSGTENVNPFAVISGVGQLQLSPCTDEWQDTVYTPANVIQPIVPQLLNQVAIDGSFTFGNGGNFNWSTNNFVPVTGYGPTVRNYFNGWNGTRTWNWNGAPINGNNNDFNAGLTSESRIGVSITGARYASRHPGGSSFSNRIVTSTNTIREVVGDREVSLTFLPFIRSRKIFFRAQGLTPNTQYYAFFDGVPMDNFVREESFQRYSASTSGGVEYGHEFRESTSHPQGSSILVTNNAGKIEGSLFIPCQKDVEDQVTLRFRAGVREFKLLDISANDDEVSTSSARYNYIAKGTLSTREATVTSTRPNIVLPKRWTKTSKVSARDPLAQSFRVTDTAGIFVTKIECFFKTKDNKIPIELQIRPLVNGAPSSIDIIGNAIKFVDASSVALPAGQTAAEVIAAPTVFEFEEPVFLNPNTEYAIVLLADSINYEAYVAETYAFLLGSTEARISRQPSLGSLFKSQNGSTWEPDQTKDLMFNIYKAEFDTAGATAIFENTDVQKELLTVNPLYSSAEHGSDSDRLTALIPNHGFSVNDTVNISGLTGATLYNDIYGKDINGARTVREVDGFAIRFDTDSANAASGTSGVFGGATVKVDKQINFDGCVPNFQTLVPDDTSVAFGAKFTAGESLSAGGQKYQKDNAFSYDIAIGEENYFTSPRLIASPTMETSQIGGNRSTTWAVSLNTTRADVSPIIDTQRVSLTTISNLIDNQVASSASAGETNIPLNYVAETEAFGGSSLAKHISSVQILEESAVGLKVILSAIRPSASDFDLYFRTSNDGENIFEVDWILQEKEQTVGPDDRNFREYRYLIGGVSGSLDDFTQYQFKIVMRSGNSSLVPIFKDFRSIALAV